MTASAGAVLVAHSESEDCGRGAQSNDSTTLTPPLDPWKLFEVLSRQVGEGKAERGLGRANWHKRSDRFCQSRQGGWARAEAGLFPLTQRTSRSGSQASSAVCNVPEAAEKRDEGGGSLGKFALKLHSEKREREKS